MCTRIQKDVVIPIFLCIYPLKVQVSSPGHTLQLFVLTVFLNNICLLEVREGEESSGLTLAHWNFKNLLWDRASTKT